MRRMDTEELCELEVINLCGGERIGYPRGVELDLDTGCAVALIVRLESTGFSLFDSREDMAIPWCRIECIGADAILVKLDAGERGAFISANCRKRRNKVRKL